MNLLINIDVPDLEPAIDYYSNAFGLKLNRMLDDDVAELTGASSTIYLLKKDEDSTCSKYSTATRHYERLGHLSILTWSSMISGKPPSAPLALVQRLKQNAANDENQNA